MGVLDEKTGLANHENRSWGSNPPKNSPKDEKCRENGAIKS